MDYFELREFIANQQRAGQDVEIPAHGGIGASHRTADLGEVADAPVVVRYHCPEPAERMGGNLYAQAGHVAFEECHHVGCAPSPTVGIAAGQI